MSSLDQKTGDRPEYSPVFLHGRREAIVIFSVWVLCLFWAVPFCYFTGYVKDFDPENFKMVLGMPAWLFWGILIPWIAADIFTAWFCLFYFKDDDLGESADAEGTRLIEEDVN